MFRAAHRLWIRNEAFFHFPLNLRRYIRHSAYYIPNRPQQFVALRGLEQIPRGAIRNASLATSESGFMVRKISFTLAIARHCLLQPSRCIQTVQQRHTDIDQHQLRVQFLCRR